ncbi:MAG: LacI family transcriptional regulator [Bifidobacteriaceae bacterium]|jgi:LacI family transcriptional regulator|nr:LacI family transcriptional regulator [Bifidobacteriaceae bacterium]
MTDQVPRSSGQAGAPRITDVAALAGVSRATAARALGGYGSVSFDTSRRVQEAAVQLGYRSNEIARAMRLGHTSTIGLVIADISGSFFYQATLAIIRTAARLGFQTLVLNTDEDFGAERRAVRELLDKRVDGLIIVTSARTGHDYLTNPPPVPVVFLDRRADDVDACVVSTDDESAARECVSLFTRHGHSRVGLLCNSSTVDGKRLPYTSPLAISTMVGRVTGWMSGMKQAGLPVRSDWLVFAEDDHESAKASAIRLLSQRDRPSALLAINSELALAAIDACHTLKLEIGSDISLIGFDDTAWAPLISPALTVVSRPVYRLGALALENLVLQISGSQFRPESVVLSASLIERASVDAPRGG